VVRDSEIKNERKVSGPDILLFLDLCVQSVSRAVSLFDNKESHHLLLCSLCLICDTLCFCFFSLYFLDSHPPCLCNDIYVN